jgi:hypothetical protein
MARRIALPLCVALAFLLASDAWAISTCRARISRLGEVEVSAAGVSGNLHWGRAAGQESLLFADAGTCVRDGVARGCHLASSGTEQARVTPASCAIHLEDDASTCVALVRQCVARPPILTVRDATGAIVGTSPSILVKPNSTNLAIDTGSGIGWISITIGPLSVVRAAGPHVSPPYFESGDCSGPPLFAATGSFAFGIGTRIGVVQKAGSGGQPGLTASIYAYSGPGEVHSVNSYDDGGICQQRSPDSGPTLVSNAGRFVRDLQLPLSMAYE